MLITERNYLSNIEHIPIIDSSKNLMLEEGLDAFETSTTSLRSWIEEKSVTNVWYLYLLSILDIVRLVILRLITCVLSLPGYALIGIAVLIDGLVQRDIRKFTGEYESSYVFHRAARLVVPSVVGTMSIYIILPFSLHPAIVFTPSMLLFAITLFLTASRFKKFL